MYILKKNLNPILFFFCYSCILIFSTIGDFNLFDWDEINFAESSREMFVTNNFSQVMINFEPFHEKPPLFFWLQVISFKIFGVTSFAARFPNALLSIITPIILFKIGDLIKNTTFGWIWSIIFIAGLLPNLYFRTGIIDPYFNLFIFLSIYFFFTYLRIKHLKYIFLSSFFSGLAILSKGPVGLLIVLLSCFIYLILFSIKVPFKHVFFFFITVILVSSPWYFFELINKGPWFIIEFLQYQIELFSLPVAGHKQPIYYHFLVVLFGCIPFSFFAFKNSFKDSGSGIAFEKMMRIVLWVVLILFTIVSTKIVHYSSMAYLPLSFLASIEIYKLYMGKSFHWVLKYALSFTGIFIGLILMFLFYVLIHQKEFLINSVNDLYIQNLLSIELNWIGWEWIIPSLFILGSIIWLTIFESKILFSLVSYSLVIGLFLSLLSKFTMPKIEGLTQGSVISFYKEISDEKKYLTTVGYKSYAHYFYSEFKPLKSTDLLYHKKKEILRNIFNKSSLSDLNRKEKKGFNNYVLGWLINGDIDRTVYFSAKNNRPILQLENTKNLKVVKDYGGYKIYKRELK
jgi:hypothetical protein